MPYLGKSPSFGVRQRYQYTATASQTTFSGTDLGNLTLTYTDNNFVDVYQNGVLLKGGGNDYTATSGTSVVLATGATADDVIEIIVYDAFSAANFYSRTDSDSRYLNVAGDTMTGSLDLNGTELVLDVDADTSITADTDDQIDIKIAGSDSIRIKANEIENVSGDLTIDVAGDIILDADGGDFKFQDGGTDVLNIENSSGDIKITSITNDKDIIFRGVDNSSAIEAMRIDMSEGGRVGIGTTSPYAILQTEQDTTNAIGLAVVNSSDDGSADSVGLSFGLTRSGGLIFGSEAIRVQKEQAFTGTPSTVDSSLIFSTLTEESTTEKMRITSDGHILLGTTSDGGVGNTFKNTGQQRMTMNGTGAFQIVQFANDNGQIGTIVLSGSSTSFNTSSDYRLKENVITEWDATSRLKQLKPSRFNFKTDKDTTVDGFLAHEVQSIIPEAISGTKDETQDLGTIKDKDGNVIKENVLETETKKDDGQTWTKTKTEDVYQGIDQSKLVPLLTKALQESIARADALEARIKKLEDG